MFSPLQLRAQANQEKATQLKLAAITKLAEDQKQEIARLRSTRAKRAKYLNPSRPSVALELAYRKKLYCLIDDLNKSVLYWVRAGFRANEPEVTELAQDALPAAVLQKIIRRLSRRWQKEFTQASRELATWFSRRVYDRSTRDLQSILRRGGWTVELKLTRAQRDILEATVRQNVSLIRSIPSR